MNKWYTICAKFNEGQKKAIEEYKKKYNLDKTNQVMKKAVEDLIGITYADYPRVPEGVKVAFSFVDDYKTQIKDSKARNEFEKFSLNWIRNFWHQDIEEFTQKAVELEEAWEAFRHQKKRGRPKIVRHRGKPMDTGYEGK